jgi:hypothetical protein
MPTATTRNGFRKPDVGSDNNTWGSYLNSAVFDLVDASLDGWTEITSSGTTTLTGTQYVPNEARQRFIYYSASGSGTLIIPSVEKWYIVWAENNDVLVTTGGVGVTVKAGSIGIVSCDGTDCVKVQDRDFDSHEITGVANPTSNQSAATKAYVDGVAFSSSNLPGITPSTDGMFVGSNGTSAAWAFTGFNGVSDKSSSYSLAITDRQKIISCTGTFTLTSAALATLGTQFYCRIINVGSGLVTFDPNGSETIVFPGQSAKTSCVLIPGEGIDLFCGASYFLATPCVTPSLCLYAYESTAPSYTQTTWTSRPISTVSINTIGASYSSNEIQGVPPGVYRAVFGANGSKSNSFSVRLYNNTANSVLGYSDTAQSGSGDATYVRATGIQDITLSASSSLTVSSYGASASGDWSITGAGGGSPVVGAELRLFRISP